MIMFRSTHRLVVAHKEELLRGALEREAYWQRRAELLTDQALARAGAISQPTMVDAPKAQRDMAAQMISAIAMREMDSSRKPERQGS